MTTAQAYEVELAGLNDLEFSYQMRYLEARASLCIC